MQPYNELHLQGWNNLPGLSAASTNFNFTDPQNLAAAGIFSSKMSFHCLVPVYLLDGYM